MHILLVNADMDAKAGWMCREIPPNALLLRFLDGVCGCHTGVQPIVGTMVQPQSFGDVVYRMLSSVATLCWAVP